MSRAVPLAALTLVAAAPATPTIEAPVPIALSPGVTNVPGFLPDGTAAQIVEGWHGNDNAHGYDVFMVLTGSYEQPTVGLAPFFDERGGEIADTVRDDPFDGERVLGTVRFVRARLDGKPASLALTAHLRYTSGGALADHEQAEIEVFALVASDDLGPPLAFRRIARLVSPKRYCHADLALRDVLNVPLPADFAGFNRIDGCPG